MRFRSHRNTAVRLLLHRPCIDRSFHHPVGVLEPKKQGAIKRANEKVLIYSVIVTHIAAGRAALSTWMVHTMPIIARHSSDCRAVFNGTVKRLVLFSTVQLLAGVLRRKMQRFQRHREKKRIKYKLNSWSHRGEIVSRSSKTRKKKDLRDFCARSGSWFSDVAIRWAE
jgi:hypothetical protein